MDTAVSRYSPLPSTVGSPAAQNKLELSSSQHRNRACAFLVNNYAYMPIISSPPHVYKAVSCLVMAIFFSFMTLPSCVAFVTSKIFWPKHSDALKNLSFGIAKGSIICASGTVAHAILAVPILGNILTFAYNKSKRDKSV